MPVRACPRRIGAAGSRDDDKRALLPRRLPPAAMFMLTGFVEQEAHWSLPTNWLYAHRSVARGTLVRIADVD